MKDQILRAAEGALGGVLGTMVISKGIGLASAKLPERYKPTHPAEDPGAFMARQAGRVRPLAPETSQKLAKNLHVAYGSTWGLLFGLAAGHRARSLGQAILGGAALGALVWAVGYVGWLPATGLTPAVHRQGGGHIASSLGLHVAYGLAAAVPVYLAERIRK